MEGGLRSMAMIEDNTAVVWGDVSKIITPKNELDSDAGSAVCASRPQAAPPPQSAPRAPLEPTPARQV